MSRVSDFYNIIAEVENYPQSSFIEGFARQCPRQPCPFRSDTLGVEERYWCDRFSFKVYQKEKKGQVSINQLSSYFRQQKQQPSYSVEESVLI